LEKSTKRSGNSRESIAALNSEALEYMTPEEVACVFSVDKRTILKWAREGKLACLKLSKRTIRFTRGSVLSFAEMSKEDVESETSSITVKGRETDKILKRRGGNKTTPRISSWRSLREEVIKCQ
jgi:excisionase family DNA binding protein